MMRHLPVQPEDGRMMRRHATAVSVCGEGVLLLGESGVGKTDLALRLIANGSILIADDQVDIMCAGEALWLSTPTSTAGVIEIHGVGLVRMPHVSRASLRLVVQCDALPSERLPPRRKWIMEGIAIEEITLNPLHPSAPAKLECVVKALQSGGLLPEDWMADSHHTQAF